MVPFASGSTRLTASIAFSNSIPAVKLQTAAANLRSGVVKTIT